MKTSEVLTKVYMHMGDGKLPMEAHRRFICYALSFLYYQVGVIGDRDRTRVKKLIRGHLNGAETLEEWLYANHRIQYVNSPEYTRKIMTTRKAWLAHLIEFYQRKGD